jgi:quercetin dioxygenase-like cupin family protein|tara:strand:- start:162 stop:662 length:501 start_codon:yes stop_codon:yes gene_type:complete
LKKGNIDTAPGKKIKKDYFTGPVILQDISRITKPTEHDVYHVNFTPGAETKLHSHTGGQMLIVTRGVGTLVYFKKIGKGITKFKIKKTQRINLSSGDVVYIPPKILHTHGAYGNKNKASRKGTVFSHIAINFYPKKNEKPKTEWYESDLTQLGRLDLRANVTSKIP